VSRYLIQRVVHAVPVLIGVTLFSFALIHFVPGNPVEIMLGGRSSPEIVERANRELGLDRPLPAQYLAFVGNAARGDFGQSIVLRRPVRDVIEERLSASLFLIGYATLLAIVAATPLAIFAARRQNTLGDHLVRLVTLLAFGMPTFWVALVLIRGLSLKLGLFPVSGYGDGVLGHIRSLTLPAITIALVLAALLTRSLRAALLEVFNAEYIEAARSRGLTERRVVYKHALRNALLATTTVLALNIGFLIGGSVIVERIFDLPGLGQLLVNSIYTRDFPMIQGLTLTFGVIVIAINLICDCAYAVIDPRIKLADR
jgi:peptide/nickel transport system permease protein